MGERRKHRRLDTRIKVVETGKIFDTSKDCANYLGVSPALVSHYLAGKLCTCGGCHLEVIEIDIDEIAPLDEFEGTTVRIPYAPGYYVSELGFIYAPGSMGKRTWHKLRSYSNDAYGHQVVDIYIDGKRHHKYVAVLVAEAFIPNPNKLPIVRHRDGNPLNNHVSNLEWGTHADNMDDAKRHGTFHYFTPEEDEMSLRVLRTPVRAINVHTGEIQDFPSQADAARALGVHQPNIRHVLSGWYKQTGGYRFEYLDKEEFDEQYY